MTFSFEKAFLAASALAAVVGCSSASSPAPLKPPDGATCSQGTISANGAAVSGTVSSTNCSLNDAYDNVSPLTASNAVAVKAGTLYSVTSTVSGNVGWASNLLVGETAADTELLVAASDGYSNAAPLTNVLWFYAPTSGTYSLRTLNGDTTVHTYTYTTQLVTCPVISTVTVSDTDYVDSASSVGTSGCKQQYTFFGDEDDSTFVNYYLVQFGAGQTRFFNVQSTAFTAGLEIGGPGFDSMWDLDGSNGTSVSGNDNYESLTSDTAGTYTLAVGATTHGQSGAYRLSVLAPSLVPVEHVSTPLGRTVHLGRAARVHMLH